MSDSTTLCDIGFIGLGVMGKNLALNLAGQWLQNRSL